MSLAKPAMMRFRITSLINDGLAEAPPIEVGVKNIPQLVIELLALDAFTNDYGDPRGVGSTVHIERVA